MDSCRTLLLYRGLDEGGAPSEAVGLAGNFKSVFAVESNYSRAEYITEAAVRL